MEEIDVAEVTVVTPDSEIEGNRSDESVTEDIPEELDLEAGISDPLDKPPEGKTEPPAGEGGEVVAAKVVYTPEELESLLQGGAEVDTSRLSVEGKVLMKSFQRGLDKKFQQVAEMRKSIEAQSKPKDAREQLFDRYVQDPGGVTGEINTEVERLEAVDPTDAGYAESRQMIARLRSMKDDFSIRRQTLIESTQQSGNIVSITQAEIAKAIPDFETKAPKLTEFAIGLGFSIGEVRALTDPLVVGPMAIKLTRAINTMYDKLNAPKSAEDKVKKDAPPPLQRGGGGRSIEKKTEDDPGTLPMSEYLVRRKKFAE